MDTSDLFSTLYNRIEIRTAATPPLVIDMKSPPNPYTRALLEKLKPALIMNGPAGQKVIAPYGMPEGISQEIQTAGIQTGLGLMAGAVGVFLLLHVMLK